uniref:Uncharacterized protein n=1 Tax=Ixodes ricinus TaxID=34613 RepID=A0A6B0UIG7_IXORI
MSPPHHLLKKILLVILLSYSVLVVYFLLYFRGQGVRTDEAAHGLKGQSMHRKLKGLQFLFPYFVYFTSLLPYSTPGYCRLIFCCVLPKFGLCGGSSTPVSVV